MHLLSNGNCVCQRYPAPTVPRSTSAQKWRLKLRIGPRARNTALIMPKSFTTSDPTTPWTSTLHTTLCPCRLGSKDRCSLLVLLPQQFRLCSSRDRYRTYC